MGPEILFQITEEDLATAYAERVCPQCQAGECKLAGGEHDLSVYWTLPEERRRELVGACPKALEWSSATEAVFDAINAALDAHITPADEKEVTNAQGQARHQHGPGAG